MSAIIQGKGDVFGPIGAVAGNIPVFDGTTGKIIKDGGKTLPVGNIVGTTDTQDLSNKQLVDPLIAPGAGIAPYRAKGVIYVTTASVWNTGTGAVVMHTYTVPAGMLSKDGDCIKIVAFMRGAGTATTKTFTLNFGGNAILTLTGPLNGQILQLHAWIYRRGSASQLVIPQHFALTTVQGYTPIGLTVDTSLARVISVNGQAAAGSNEILAEATMIEFLPAP